MKKYILTEEELIELLSASLELNFLEGSGVDNWKWYKEGREEYFSELLGKPIEEVVNYNYNYKDIAKQMLSEYEEVK